MNPSNPCNFYTYRHMLLDHDAIEALRQERFTLESDQEDEQNFTPDDFLNLDRFLDFHDAWQEGITYFNRRNFQPAVRAFERVIENFEHELKHRGKSWLEDRQTTDTLEELQTNDWQIPLTHQTYQSLDGLGFPFPKELPDASDKWVVRIYRPRLMIAKIFAPLAKAEALIELNRFDEALLMIEPLIPQEGTESQLWNDHFLVNRPIELPFIKMLKANIFIQKGDSEYRQWDGHYEQGEEGEEKAEALDKATDAYNDALEVLKAFGTYVDEVQQATADRQNELNQLIGTGDEAQPYIIYNSAVLARRDHLLKTGALKNTKLVNATKATTQQSKSLQQLGADPRLAGVTFHANRYFGPARPFPLPPITLGERNPRVYELVLMAWSRLQQIANKMNYLGYRYDYVPPWRFSYLLDRARYFTDHTRQLQEKYLNFISTAEREDFAEQEAANTLALETQNVAIEQKRVNQATREEEAAIAAVTMATLSADNAQSRIDNYNDFADEMDKLEAEIEKQANIETGLTIATSGLRALGSLASYNVEGAIADGLSIGTAVSQNKQKDIQLQMQNEQRELEKENLELAKTEAEEAKKVAQAEAKVAAEAITVAALQHTAAQMREDFARQAVAFLENRTINSELWYRLADQLNRVAQTYLKRATELAFLAEQAYEFESGNRLNVIRFDYGLSSTGNFLAGDFLLSDLDHIEHQYISTVRKRQQQVRFVVSLARDFPTALQELQEHGSAMLHVPLRIIEQRFAGLHNCRISSVAIQPLALMDPTRFALQLNHQGNGFLRVHAKSDSSDALSKHNSPSWCIEADDQFPIKLQINEPQTEVLSGMSRQEALLESPDQAIHQRIAFEGLAAASSWFIDMSMRENRIDPATLADVIITFNMTGYHDDELKDIVSANLSTAMVQTLHLSGKDNFSDTFHIFQQNGQMHWDVTSQAVPVGLKAGRLRNLGLQFSPNVRSSHFSNLIATHQVNLSVDEDGILSINSPIPKLEPRLFSINKLDVQFQLDFDEYNESTIKSDPISRVSINWGDSDEFIDHKIGDYVIHTYKKPETYHIKLRVIYGKQKMRDFVYRVSVSNVKKQLIPQLTYPRFQPVPGSPHGGIVKFRLDQGPGNPGEGIWFWSFGGKPHKVEKGIQEIELEIGRDYVLRFTSIRILKAKLWSNQCYSKESEFEIKGLVSSSNRKFSDDGNLKELGDSFLSNHIFSDNREQSPLDQWHCQISGVQISSRRTESVEDLTDIRDIKLILEYDATTIN